MDQRRKTEYANKVKCSTLKPVQPNPTGINESRKIMLGLTNEDSVCEYEQKSVIPKRKKGRQNEAIKVESPEKFTKSIAKISEPETVKESQENALLCHEPIPQPAIVGETLPSTEQKPKENSFLNDPIPIDDNSKAFMGSFGSWINDLFSPPDNKKPHPVRKVETKTFHQPQPQPQVLPDEDSDYFKTINVLKEEFRKKLKSETSVHILNGDKLLQFNFNECGNKKLKKRSKSLPSTGSLVRLTDVKDEKELLNNDQFGVEVKRQNANDLLNFFDGCKEKETSVQLYKAKNELNLTSLNLIKEKKKHKRKGRSNEGTMEEYVFPVPTDLSKRLLLNLDDQEKCSRLYKNSHVGIQENHYVQKNRKSYQNSTRCYTTNASLPENLEIIPPKAHAGGNIRRNSSSQLVSPGKRKAFGDFARNNSTFVKVRSQRSASSAHIDASKIDSKNSSDDLVRYLMKKVKVQHRPQQQQPKKKSTHSFMNSPSLTSGKSKFMQSATSSLVMNVLSKKDSDILLSTKGASRVVGGEKIDLLNIKPVYQAKGWSQKYDDAQVRLDIKRVSTQNRLNKSTYLSDDHNDLDSSNLFFGKNSRQYKRLYDPTLKADTKKSSEKYGRRPEGKSLSSKLDKSNIYKMAKIKPKNLNKKSMSNFLENLGNVDGKENSFGKFQHQHELFKNSLKSVQQNCVEPEAENESEDDRNNEKELKAATNVVSPLPVDLSSVENNFQLIPDESSEINQCESVNDDPQLQEIKVGAENVLGCFNVDDNSLNLSMDKNKALDKPAPAKMKSLQFFKEENSSVLLGPTDTEKALTAANSFESPAEVVQDVRHAKSPDTLLLNRKLPLNTPSEVSKQKNTSPASNNKVFLLTERDQCKDGGECGKRQSKEKKKESLKKTNPEKGSDCGFEKTKKPGPSCENGVAS